ncbi:nucleotide pyrophosphohydrolase [Algoriphagus lacus]|uniref:Nucleotide pyrophosphohydrolase n=1 Tax=Algoriphagus lacus TaxID=2056311 RepID=A0A418PM49_9BACT|nr:nucleotide pyrophosphohydrolase [Algoriphagus lacus]RIW11977.1 nucleotide pyrophosphohydrolase [Algoriphagus lacus]
MSDLEQVIEELIRFRNERDWEQFHNSKDLAIAISIEANELLEQFLWKKEEGADRERIKEELADVFLFGLLLVHKHGFDLKEILLEKIRINAEKYPVSKSKGSAKKYDQL